MWRFKVIGSKFRFCLILLLAASAAVALFFGMRQLRGNQSSGYVDRTRVSAIVLGFLNFEKHADAYLSDNLEFSSLDVLNEKWVEDNGPLGGDVTGLAFGRNGEVVLVSGDLGEVIIFRPDASDRSWHCKMFPPVSHPTLCSKFSRPIPRK
jgi:hypothetical protein